MKSETAPQPSGFPVRTNPAGLLPPAGCRLLLLLLMVSGGAGVVASNQPRYTERQLSRPELVRAELQKYQTERESLRRQLTTASELEKIRIKNDLRKLDQVLEVLRHVDLNGFRRDDPWLKQLSYFRQVVISDYEDSAPEADLVKRKKPPDSTGKEKSINNTDSADTSSNLPEKEPPASEESPDRQAWRLKCELAVTRFLKENYLLTGLFCLVWAFSAGILLYSWGIKLAGGCNYHITGVIFTTLIRYLLGLIPCAGYLLGFVIIDWRHETGLWRAIVIQLAIDTILAVSTVVCLIIFLTFAVVPSFPG